MFATLTDGLSHLNPRQRAFEPDHAAVEFFQGRNERYLRWAAVLEESSWLGQKEQDA
jgi:hypothetical protein